MFLTAYNLPHYLISRGRVDLRSLVDGDFAIAEAGRRNRNFKVLRRNSNGLFVKQIKTTEAQAISTIQREAAFYRAVQNHPACDALRKLMPALVDYDERRYAITLTLADNTETMYERQMREGRYGEELAASLGRALGLIHSHATAMLADPATRSLFAYQVAWPLTLDMRAEQTIQALGPIGPALLAGMRQFPALLPLLGALRAEWRYDSLIHNDMKWDNCLLKIKPESDPELTIVDWEMADIGDGAWDVASIFKEYVIAMLMNAGSATLPVQSHPAPAPIPLESMQPAVRSFWRAYASARGLSAMEGNATLLRAMRFTAGRMIIGVLEFFGPANDIGPFGNLMLQASAGILEAPHIAITQLFGTEPLFRAAGPGQPAAFAAQA